MSRQPFRLYETVLVDRSAPLDIGVQVLSVPASEVLDIADVLPVKGHIASFDVVSVVADDADRRIEIETATYFQNCVSLLADGQLDAVGIEDVPGTTMELLLGFDETRASREFTQMTMYVPAVAVEESPLAKRSLGDLFATGYGASLIFFSGIPPIVAVIAAGGAVIFVRGLHAAAGALWEGARPEVVKLGQEGGAILAAVIRRRLGIPDSDRVVAGAERE